jgi:hypothetical protein
MISFVIEARKRSHYTTKVNANNANEIANIFYNTIGWTISLVPPL